MSTTADRWVLCRSSLFIAPIFSLKQDADHMTVKTCWLSEERKDQRAIWGLAIQRTLHNPAATTSTGDLLDA